MTKANENDVTKENENELTQPNGVDVTKENGVEVNAKSEVYVTKDFGISRSYQEVSIAIGEGSDENIVEMDTAMMDQSSSAGGEGDIR